MRGWAGKCGSSDAQRKGILSQVRSCSRVGGVGIGGQLQMAWRTKMHTPSPGKFLSSFPTATAASFPADARDSFVSSRGSLHVSQAGAARIQMNYRLAARHIRVHVGVTPVSDASSSSLLRTLSPLPTCGSLHASIRTCHAVDTIMNSAELCNVWYCFILSVWFSSIYKKSSRYSTWFCTSVYPSTT